MTTKKDGTRFILRRTGRFLVFSNDEVFQAFFEYDDYILAQELAKNIGGFILQEEVSYTIEASFSGANSVTTAKIRALK